MLHLITLYLICTVDRSNIYTRSFIFSCKILTASVNNHYFSKHFILSIPVSCSVFSCLCESRLWIPPKSSMAGIIYYTEHHERKSTSFLSPLKFIYILTLYYTLSYISRKKTKLKRETHDFIMYALLCCSVQV